MWRILEWSRETGRGRIRPTSGTALEFDAAVALVDDFRIGEEVHVEVERKGDGWRVLRLWPDDPRFVPPTPPTTSAPSLSPDIEASVRGALSNMDIAYSYSVVTFTPELLILQGAGVSAYPMVSGALEFREPVYVELAAFIEVKALRLSTNLERDYLASRIGSLSSEQIAFTLVNASDLFRFIVAAGVATQVDRTSAGA